MYYGGMILTGIGFVLFMIPFFYVFSIFTSDVFNMDMESPFRSFQYGFVGFILIAVGSWLRQLGARGLAGSGVVLDPQRAREDLKPYSKAAGGMLHDALEEVDLNDPKQQGKELIKVRCQACKTLNDETDKFCSQCGKPLV